jgi:hypothetical protein
MSYLTLATDLKFGWVRISERAAIVALILQATRHRLRNGSPMMRIVSSAAKGLRNYRSSRLTVFEFALGIDLPQTLLARADHVIE